MQQNFDDVTLYLIQHCLRVPHFFVEMRISFDHNPFSPPSPNVTLAELPPTAALAQHDTPYDRTLN